MIAPGGAFCFDPFSFQRAGSPVTNDKLVEWCSSSGIKSVKLLWQTKENGDVGDPVMGIANGSNDHTNIVDIKRTDGSDPDVYKRQRLENILSNQLPQWELKYGNGVDENTLSTRFSGVIRRASEQAGCGVVVLVDEYDTLAASPRQ